MGPGPSLILLPVVAIIPSMNTKPVMKPLQMSPLAMSLRDRYCMSRKGGTEGGGLVDQRMKQHGHVWAWL